MSEERKCRNCIYDEPPCEECRDHDCFEPKLVNTKCFELIPHDKNNSSKDHQTIYIWAVEHKLEKGSHNFYMEENQVIEIPAILIYEVKDKGYMNE